MDALIETFLCNLVTQKHGKTSLLSFFPRGNCYLEPKTFNALRRACKTGAPFTGVILNRRKSGAKKKGEGNDVMGKVRCSFGEVEAAKL